MNKYLYVTRASRFVEADPARGIENSETEYSGYKIVVASNSDLAAEKLLTDLGEYKEWKCAEIKELTAGADIPLEKRVEILREIFPVIE